VETLLNPKNQSTSPSDLWRLVVTVPNCSSVLIELFVIRQSKDNSDQDTRRILDLFASFWFKSDFFIRFSLTNLELSNIISNVRSCSWYLLRPAKVKKCSQRPISTVQIKVEIQFLDRSGHMPRFPMGQLGNTRGAKLCYASSHTHNIWRGLTLKTLSGQNNSRGKGRDFSDLLMTAGEIVSCVRNIKGDEYWFEIPHIQDENFL